MRTGGRGRRVRVVNQRRCKRAENGVGGQGGCCEVYVQEARHTEVWAGMNEG